MRYVLEFLQNQFFWLFAEGFKIVDSDYYDSFGGQGAIDLANDRFRISFRSDRDQVHVSIAPLPMEGFEGVVSIDLFVLDKTGELGDSRASESLSAYLRENLDEIASWFEGLSAEELIQKTTKLMGLRSKLFWG